MRTTIRRKAAAIGLLAGIALTGVACEEGVEEDIEDIGEEVGEEVDPDAEDDES